MSTINELKWSYLTGAVNEIKSPNQFLRRLLYGNRQAIPTEDIELSLISKGRVTAPFVRKNGEGVMVQGVSETFQTVAAPNIRIKRPFTPSELLYTRRPGTAIFVNGGSGISQGNAIRDHINRDLQAMADMVTNSEEWMAAQALQGTISYSVEGADVFQVTFPKPAGNTITLASDREWSNDGGTHDPTLARPLQDFHTVKRVFSDEVGMAPTDAIFGEKAANALLELVEAGHVKMLGQQGTNVSVGDMTFVSQFSDDGAIFLGTLGGIRCWEYSRQVTHNGSATSLIRTDYVEFVSTSRMSERVLYYGAIPDMRAIANGRLGQMQRFSKSWDIEDPSGRMALLASRPLPVPRRPGAMVSLKVTNV